MVVEALPPTEEVSLTREELSTEAPQLIYAYIARFKQTPDFTDAVMGNQFFIREANRAAVYKKDGHWMKINFKADAEGQDIALAVEERENYSAFPLQKVEIHTSPDENSITYQNGKGPEVNTHSALSAAQNFLEKI